MVTTDHEVIRQWAKARKAVPATVEGTETNGHLGVLRLNCPGTTVTRLTEVAGTTGSMRSTRPSQLIYQQKQTAESAATFPAGEPDSRPFGQL